MAEVKLSAETRSEFGKGAARRLRRENKVPAVLYGHGTDPVHVSLPGHETMLALKNSNALLALEIEGKKQLALPKDVQRHATKGFIKHVDLILVRSGEKVTVDVPLHIVGSPVSGTIVTQDMTTISVEVEATHIPKSIDVDIDGAGEGTHINASEVTLPEGATLVSDPEALVLLISTPGSSSDAADEASDAADAEAQAAASAAASEG